MSENLRRTAEHDRIVRPRTKIKHEQNREEVSYFRKIKNKKHKIDILYFPKYLLIHLLTQSFQKINQQIQNFVVLQQQERAKVVEQPIWLLVAILASKTRI